MGGRGSSSSGSRVFTHFHDAESFFGAGSDKGMYPEWERSATQDERDGAVYYTTGAYQEINKHLRGGTLDQASDKVKEAVKKY